MPKRTIAVDFDGVLHGYSKGHHDGTIYDPGDVFDNLQLCTSQPLTGQACHEGGSGGRRPKNSLAYRGA